MAISVFKPGGGASDFEFPATDGTAGQALVTNGAGALSFATMSLPDGATIGGVMYFNRPTKPTERSAGVPLVVRDRWYNTSDGTEWFWNGTYWLSANQRITTVTSRGGGVTTGNKWSATEEPVKANIYPFLVQTWHYHLDVIGTVDGSNYYTLAPRIRYASTSEEAFGSAVNLQSVNNYGSVALNLLLGRDISNAGNSPLATLGVVFAAVGSPTLPQNLHVSFYHREAYL